MRLPPIAQVAGVYVAGLWTGRVVFVPAWALLTMAAGVMLAVGAHRWRAVIVVSATTGLLAGMWHAEHRRTSCEHRWGPGRVAAYLQVHDAPGESGTTRATVVHAPIGCHGTVRVRVPEPVPAGATIVAVGQVRGRGLVTVEHLRVLDRHRPWRFRVRAAVAGRIHTLYGDRSGLIEALVLGRRDDVPRELRRVFADAGLAHLLAISGLHVGILASWLVLVLGWLGIRHGRWAVGAVGTWGYVALLGFPAAATRAATFLTLIAWARWRQRHPPLSAIVAAAVLLIVAIDPAAVASVGAWLSVAAVLGTAWGSARMPLAWRRRPPLKLLAASMGAVLFTSPITAFVFGSVSPIGIVSNLAAIPLAGVAVPGVFLSLLVGPAAGGAALALTAIERIADLAATVPGGHLVGIEGPAFALPWVLVLGSVLYLGSGRAIRLPRRLRRLLVAAVVAVWVSAAGAVLAARGDADTLEVHLLDVGQGDAILVRTPRGHWLAIDGGPRAAGTDAGRRVVVPYLRTRGVRAIEAVVLSHGDADHLGGVPALLREFAVGMVVEPGQPLGTSLYLELLDAVDRYGAEWRAARTGDTLRIDSVTVAVLHPTPTWIAGEFEPNENSLVLHLRYGCFDLLLAGDAGHPVERELLGRVPAVEVLKVGHHGSAGSTGEPWLDALRPQDAVISVGRNTYGHPSPTVTELLGRKGVRLWRTDHGGTVTISTDGRYFRVEQGRPSTVAGRLLCRIRALSPSSGSFSTRNGCTPKPPAISRTCSTTSPSPRK